MTTLTFGKVSTSQHLSPPPLGQTGRVLTLALPSGVVDSSGVRFFYTDQLRQHDAGTIVFGHNVSPLHIIPPVQRWHSKGYCDSTCTSQVRGSEDDLEVVVGRG